MPSFVPKKTGLIHRVVI